MAKITPEGAVKKRTKEALKKYGAYQHWPVLNGMGMPTLDCVGCYNGKFYAIETKAGKLLPTPRQEQTIKEMHKAGAAVFVINEVIGMEELLTWLQEHAE